MTMDEIKVGDTIWFLQYNGVSSGVVAAIKERSSYREKKFCVDSGDSWTVVEAKPSEVFFSLRDAEWARANKLQREASAKLQEAAAAYERAGAPAKEESTA